jgi:hypothetical protein
MGELGQKVLDTLFPVHERGLTLAEIMEAYGYENREAPRIRLKRADVRPWYALSLKNRGEARYDREDVVRVFGELPEK